MRVSGFKYTILSFLATAILLVIALMPFHAFLSVWGSTLVGHYTALRLWKEAILLLLIIVVLILLLLDTKIRSHTLTRRLVWLCLGFAALNGALGLIAWQHGDVTLKALGYGLIIQLRGIAFFLVAWAVSVRTARLRSSIAIRVVLWPALIVVVFGLLQFFVLPHDVLKHVGYGDHTIPAFETINHNRNYPRIMSTLRGANPLGTYLLIPIAVLSVLIVRGKRAWYNILFLVACLATLFLSFSRSAWLGAIAVLITVLLLGVASARVRRSAAIAALVAALVMTGLFIGFRHNVHVQNFVFHTQDHSAVATSSNGGHREALQRGFDDVRSTPLGTGPGTAGPASVYNHDNPRLAENYFLQTGQELGWLGLAMLLLIMIGVGYILFNRRADSLCLALFASLIGITVVNLLSHAWADDTLVYVWWGLAGMAMAPPPALTTAPVVAKLTGPKNKTKRPVKTS